MLRFSNGGLLLLAACASAPDQPTATASEACRALVAAAPAEWPERLPAVLALGRAAAPDLIAALQAEPGGDGGQAAVATLGRLGDPRSRPFLLELHRDRGPLATEATLALAALPADDDPVLRELLAATAADRLADPTLRTASACALVALGQRRLAAPIWRAVLLAGTPIGLPLQRELGLPDRPRWALERYLIQRQLLRTAGTDFGLDTDAPWPDLERVTERVTRWLEASS